MRKRKVKINEGICKLTLKKGRFVDSHILPKALTTLSNKGERAIQAGLGTKPVQRFQGWYDNQLVIAQGEQILSDIDDKAIKLLRRNHLVWSGWPNDSNSIPYDKVNMEIVNNDFSIRTIEGVDFFPLKLFFMSIVWRAAASVRNDMEHINLPGHTLEQLRLAILNKNCLRESDFPVMLFQIYNKGFPHNRTPIIEKQTLEFPAILDPLEYTFCRVYMDGLIAHVALDADETYFESLKPMLLGNRNAFTLFAQPFEGSRTFNNLKTLFPTQKRDY